MLALFTSRSSSPGGAAISAWRCSGSATSPASAATSVCWASSVATSFRVPASRASITSRQPFSASAVARARPRPREAPVMMAVGMSSKLRPAPPALYRELGLGPLDQTVAYGVERRLRPVGQIELPEDVRHVRLHRLLGHAEFQGDHLVRPPAGD